MGSERLDRIAKGLEDLRAEIDRPVDYQCVSLAPDGLVTGLRCARHACHSGHHEAMRGDLTWTWPNSAPEIPE
jgi:hypothetical protein